jgi:hypothetical protein
MQTALRARLLADATIAGLVGSRVDWGLRPQAKALPAITLTLVPSPRDYHMGGAQVTQHYRVQVDCWATTYKGAHDLREAVIAELEPASGSFLGSFVERSADMPERTDTGEVHRASLDFKVTHISA